MKTLNNMLIGIVNGTNLGKRKLIIKANNLSLNVLRKLRELHLIDFFKFYMEPSQRVVHIHFRYVRGVSVISKIIIISKPKVPKYYRYKDICSIRNLYPFLGIFLTPKGILTHIECLKKKTGGTLLFLIL